MRSRTKFIAVLLAAAVSVVVWRQYSGAHTRGGHADAGGASTALSSGAGVTNAYEVQADFNGDSLIDIAVAETDTNGRNLISIYLRRDTDDPQRQFYKIGHIQNPDEFSASAIMCVQGAGYTDLIVILTQSDKRKELVHYRSQGDAFVEFKREHLSGP